MSAAKLCLIADFNPYTLENVKKSSKQGAIASMLIEKRINFTMFF
jgi:hypothetical protein